MTVGGKDERDVGRERNNRRLVGIVLIPFCLISFTRFVDGKTTLIPPKITADSYILMDAESGGVYYGRNIRRPMIPASTLKILTALLVLGGGRLERTVLIPAEAEGIEGSSMYLKAGERLTRFELLNGLLLVSANDAAVALAISDTGSVRSFVDEMNAFARRMHWNGTRCVDPSGLSDANRSDALDLACMTRVALRNPVFKRIVSAQSFRIPSRPPAKVLLCNHNKFLRRYPGADGVKTGYTIAAGHTLVASAKRGRRHWIVVLMHSRDPYGDAQRLMDFGFLHWPKR